MSLTLPPWPPEALHGPVADRKSACRRLVRQTRRELAQDLEARELYAQSLAAVADEWATSLAPAAITSYAPMATEPDVGPLNDWLAQRGVEILVPITLPDGVLHWRRWRDESGPAIGPEALSQVDAVLLPALAVDARGIRLGQGGGYYDRAQHLFPSGAPVLAVVFAHEVVAELPSEPHDLRVGGALTPEGVTSLTE